MHFHSCTPAAHAPIVWGLSSMQLPPQLRVAHDCLLFHLYRTISRDERPTPRLWWLCCHYGGVSGLRNCQLVVCKRLKAIKMWLRNEKCALINAVKRNGNCAGRWAVVSKRFKMAS